MVDTLELRIPPEHAGRRLDQSLAALLPDYSRSRIQAWCDAGEVWLEGRAAGRKDKVWGGETVRLTPTVHPAEQPHRPEPIALDVVYEDDHILVLNKPAGLVTHPGAGNWQGTLLNALLHHCPQLERLSRAGIVHRLDKDTSGLMVVAKTVEAQTRLVRAMQARTVKRVYLAVTLGRFETEQGEVDAPIGRHPVQRTRMAVVAGGRPALTRWRVLRRFTTCALVECRLETGRTHQIRVHLAHLGYPLLGDPVYAGRRQAPVHFPRQALHACRLGLTHPVSGEAMEWETPLPEDMRNLVAELEANE